MQGTYFSLNTRADTPHPRYADPTLVLRARSGAAGPHLVGR